LLRLRELKQDSFVREEEGIKGDNMLLATKVFSKGNSKSQIIVKCYSYIKAVRNALLA